MNLSKTVIYIADDDEDDRFLLRKSFQAIDPAVTIVEAEDGAELLTLLRNRSLEPVPRLASLILLDMNMPKVNGLETLIALRANPLLQHIPAVMISTSAEPDQMATAYQNGASGYIKKPASYIHMDLIAHAVSVCYLNTGVS